MKKKTVLFIGTFLIVCASALMSEKKVFAQSITSTNLLRSVDILGISVVRSASMKFYLIDARNQTTPQQVTLPTLTGNNGLVYVFRLVNGGQDYWASIIPASGEKIEGQTNYMWYLGEVMYDEMVTMVADEASGSWWVVNQSMPSN